MSTPNKDKVSAYIPKELFKHFKSFYTERKISMSQAVIVIFSEYFKVDYSVNHSSSSEILSKLQNLEEKLASLPSGSIDELLSKLSDLSFQLESLNSRVYALEQSKPLNEPLLELPGVNSGDIESETINELLNNASQIPEEKITMPLLDLLNNPPDETLGTSLTEQISVLPSESLVDYLPIPGIKLSELRFGLSKNRLSGIKSEKSLEEFIEWTRQNDPDHISWKFDQRLKGYVPAEELSSELESSLLKWIKENLRNTQTLKN